MYTYLVWFSLGGRGGVLNSPLFSLQITTLNFSLSLCISHCGAACRVAIFIPPFYAQSHTSQGKTPSSYRLHSLRQVLAFMDMQPASTAQESRHRRIPPRLFPFNLAPARFYSPHTMSLQGSQCPHPPSGLPGPLLLISSDYKDFDPDQLCRYQEEGYRVHYRQNADLKWFQEMADDIEANEPYAIIGLLYPFPQKSSFLSKKGKKEDHSLKEKENKGIKEKKEESEEKKKRKHIFLRCAK